MGPPTLSTLNFQNKHACAFCPRLCCRVFLLYLLATYVWFLFLIVAVLWDSCWHLLFFPLGLVRFGLLEYRGSCLHPTELCPKINRKRTFCVNACSHFPFQAHIRPCFLQNSIQSRNQYCLSQLYSFLSLLLKILEFKEVFVHQIFKVENNIGNSIVVSKVYFVNSLVAEINIEWLCLQDNVS